MTKKLALKNQKTSQHYSLAEKTLIPLPNASNEAISKHGIEAGKEIKLDEAFDKMRYIPDSTEELGVGKLFSYSIETANIEAVKNELPGGATSVIKSGAIKSIYTSGQYNEATKAASVFDGLTNTMWNSYADDAEGNTYLTIQLHTPSALQSFKVSGIPNISSGSTSGLRDYKIYGSNDNMNFTEIYHGKHPNNTANEVILNLNEDKNYLFLKFESLNSWFYQKRVIIGEIEYTVIPNKRLSRVLIFHGGTYKYYNGTDWVGVGSTVMENDYFIYGMSDLSTIPPLKWRELDGVIQIKECTNSTLAESTLKTEVEPYSIYEYISDFPTVVAYTEATHDIIVSTITEPFSLYDEFGDELEVLYYTDDGSVVEANLLVEAVYSPIDELDGDFEVVTWVEGQPAEAVTLEISAIPKPQLMVNSQGIDLASIENIDNIILSGLESGSGIIRVVCSFDKGNTWYRNIKPDGWVQVTLELNNVLEQGMTLSDVGTVSAEDWSELRTRYRSDEIWFAYALSISETDDVAEVDLMTAQVDMKGTWHSAIEGTDYRYSYTNNRTVQFEVLKEGDYKFNF